MTLEGLPDPTWLWTLSMWSPSSKILRNHCSELGALFGLEEGRGPSAGPLVTRAPHTTQDF